MADSAGGRRGGRFGFVGNSGTTRTTLALTLLGMTALACSSSDRPEGRPLLDDPDNEPSGPRPRFDAGAMRGDSGAGPRDASADDPDEPLPDAAPGDAMVGVPVTFDAGPGSCGDGRRFEETEECDGEQLGEITCRALGFDDGVLACSDDCAFDMSDCVGQEACRDARDNDGDGLVDCVDDDCAESCSHSCLSPVVVDVALAERQGGVLLPGNNVAHSAELESGCGLTAGGSEVVYSVVPSNDGVLSVELSSPSLLVASVQTACEPANPQGDAGVSASDELSCAPAGRSFSVPAVAGTPLFVVVDGSRPGDEGTFSLLLSLREVTCGDGVRDAGEACDDGNSNDADGCTASCELNPTEMEPNDELGDSNPYLNPFYAEIAPAGDIDVIAFESDGEQDVTLRTIDLGDDACADGQLDTLLQVFDDEGELIAEDDDSGDGFCSRLLLGTLASGSYYVSVSSVLGPVPQTFPYRLTITTPL